MHSTVYRELLLQCTLRVTLAKATKLVMAQILLIDLQKICSLTVYSLALRRRLAVVQPYLPYDLLLNITVNQAQLLHCVP